MSVKPITRMEHILAGENITPIGRREYFVQQAVQNGGGGSSETYETVAEIAVGEMEGQEGQYFYEAVAENAPEISESETYYLNDESNPSTMVQVEEGSPLVGFNAQLDGEVPSRVNPDEPLVMVAWEDERGHVLIQSDTNDLSNTTVKILKKASAPSGGDLPEVTSADNGDVLTVVEGAWAKASLPENLKATYTFGFTVTPGSEQGTFVATPNEGVTYAAIAAALAETPNVYAVLNLGFSNQIIRELFSVDSTASGSESTSALALFYDGTKFQAARLMVSANGADIVIKDT